MERKDKGGIIYDSTMEGLLKQSANLQLLQNEGINTSSLLEQTQEKIQQLQDKARLEVLRNEIKQF